MPLPPVLVVGDGEVASSPYLKWVSGRVELHQKHGLAVLVAISWSKGPQALQSRKVGTKITLQAD